MAASSDPTPRRPSFWSFSPRAFVVLAVCLAAMVYVLSPDRLMLFPSTSPRDPEGATRRFIPFESGQLEIWTARSPRCRPGVPPDAYFLRFYGNADRADGNVAPEAMGWNAARAVEIWGVNYPGFGGSTGPSGLARIGPAALTAFDALRQTAAGRPIFVFGTSMGTTAALHVAAHRPVAGVVLHNPPPLRQLVLRQYGWWNLWLLAGWVAWRIPDALDSLANARAVHAPGVFVLAEKDMLVAPRFQRMVVDAYAGEKRLVPLPGASHISPIEGPALEAFGRAVDWLLLYKTPVPADAAR